MSKILSAEDILAEVRSDIECIVIDPRRTYFATRMASRQS